LAALQKWSRSAAMLPFLRLAKAQNPLPKFLHLIISPFLKEKWGIGEIYFHKKTQIIFFGMVFITYICQAKEI